MFFYEKERGMYAVGIICELNPAHAGHGELISKTRSAYPGAAVVAALSPNFVQRGEPAVYSKLVRARDALRLGADLVIELPTPFALSSAESFARAGVSLLVSTGVVRAIAFGSESGGLSPLRRSAEILSSERCEELTRRGLRLGLSYGAARQAALEALYDGAEILKSPNNMLGVEYIRAALAQNAPLEFFTVKRESDHSSSRLREILRARGAPDAVFSEMLNDAVLSRLRVMTARDFAEIRGSGDGLAERAAKYARTAGSLRSAEEAVKTKRYASSRVRRFLLCAALGIRDDLPTSPPYIRVLAAGGAGRALLREIKRSASLPVITKTSHARRLGGDIPRLFELEAAATDLYNLAYHDPERRAGGAEWRTSPVME
ncbi:MAG: nucleotidyltransferase family protein [Oscillospiraceae bacterium]|jgi:predicted nucleotidyltransferase|nr:nucleotidyltransferase family protein [Oscillospiraceae bacterium]